MGLAHNVPVSPSDRTLKELRDDIQALQKRVQELETKVKDMQAQEVTLIGWQAASQVFDGMTSNRVRISD
ncbi:hypothetical protein C8R48DRAFT_712759 [Suillus tomentosus]|nr:hypothetical protein C8R48DRAFT_712759 [Suillus tomentosus]